MYGYLGLRDAPRACFFDFPENVSAVAFVSGGRQRWRPDPWGVSLSISRLRSPADWGKRELPVTSSWPKWASKDGQLGTRRANAHQGIRPLGLFDRVTGGKTCLRAPACKSMKAWKHRVDKRNLLGGSESPDVCRAKVSDLWSNVPGMFPKGGPRRQINTGCCGMTAGCRYSFLELI